MRLLAALVTVFFTSLASATTDSTDYSDMWWVPNESGWGANVIQQGDILFVTLFVYDSSGIPTWYVSPQTTFQGGGLFTGPLFRTTGPYFGGPFNPQNVVATQVGTLTFNASSTANAALTYSVNGVNVNKAITRQTFRTENLAGSYMGGTTGTFSGCSQNGVAESFSTYTIQQTAANVTLNEFGEGYSCRYNGTLTQTGRTGMITGTGLCTDSSNQQSFNATDVFASTDAISMKFQFVVGACRFSGRLGGVRRP